jgi:hypothetical protein
MFNGAAAAPSLLSTNLKVQSRWSTGPPCAHPAGVYSGLLTGMLRQPQAAVALRSQPVGLQWQGGRVQRAARRPLSGRDGADLKL